MSTEKEFEVGALYEYISDHQTILWSENEKFKNVINVKHYKVIKGDLFVFLAKIDKTTNPDFLICKVLIVEDGIIGDIVCRKEDIVLKK